MNFGKKILNEAYPFYRGFLNVRIDTLTVCLPVLKLSAVNMLKGDVYVITSLSEISMTDKNKLNYLDYQLIESDTVFMEQFEFFKKFIQEQFSNDHSTVKFKIIERIYILNSLNINAIIL